MKAIQTKYIPATDYRPSRVKAYTEGGLQITISFDDTRGINDAHDRACKALLDKLDWGGVWVRGGSADGRGCVYVNSAGGKIARSSHCLLCGQQITDGKPCGCGAR